MSNTLDQVLENIATEPPGIVDAGIGTTLAAGSIMHIPVTVQVVLGTARLPLSKVAELRAGSIVMLDQALGTPAVILVNGREVARGDLFVLEGDDSRLGITITEVISAARSTTSI